MNQRDWIQITLFVGLLVLCTPLLGGYMAKVFAGERMWLTRWLGCLVQMIGAAEQDFISAATGGAGVADARARGRRRAVLTTSALILITPTLRDTALLVS